MSNFSVMSISASSSVNTEAIFVRKKNVDIAIVMMSTSEQIVMVRKNFFASGTFYAPMQLPIMPAEAEAMPRGTINRVPILLRKIVVAASSRTPRVPARIVRTSKAHHSEQSIRIEGNPIFM